MQSWGNQWKSMKHPWNLELEFLLLNAVSSHNMRLCQVRKRSHQEKLSAEQAAVWDPHVGRQSQELAANSFLPGKSGQVLALFAPQGEVRGAAVVCGIIRTWVTHRGAAEHVRGNSVPPTTWLSSGQENLADEISHQPPEVCSRCSPAIGDGAIRLLVWNNRQCSPSSRHSLRVTFLGSLQGSKCLCVYLSHNT